MGAKSFADELPLARLTANFAGNVDLVPIPASGITPISANRRGLATHHEPLHAGNNLFWLQSIMAAAQQDGLGALLTGQGGNATLSWTGATPLRERLAKADWKGAIQSLVYPHVPVGALRSSRALFRKQKFNWKNCAIHPDFERHANLTEQLLALTGSVKNFETWYPPRLQRFALILPGASFLGSLWTAKSASYGVEARDPTFEKRIMEFTIGMPDREFLGPDGTDRWLIRSAMQGLMPDEVRFNNHRGYQATDIAQRLLHSAGEVETALAEVENSPLAGKYISTPRLRATWNALQQEITPETTHHTITILCRGLMAGLYLTELEK